MRISLLGFFILITCLFHNGSMAGKVSIHIENIYYDIPTKLCIKMTNKKGEEETHDFEIPAKADKRNSVETDASIDCPKDCKFLSFKLFSTTQYESDDKKEKACNDDKRKKLQRKFTLLASSIFKTYISTLTSLRLHIDYSEIQIHPEFKLPPSSNFSILPTQEQEEFYCNCSESEESDQDEASEEEVESDYSLQGKLLLPNSEDHPLPLTHSPQFQPYNPFYQ